EDFQLAKADTHHTEKERGDEDEVEQGADIRDRVLVAKFWHRQQRGVVEAQHRPQADHAQRDGKDAAEVSGPKVPDRLAHDSTSSGATWSEKAWSSSRGFSPVQSVTA